MKASRFAALIAVILLLRPADSDAQGVLFWDTSASNGVQGGTGNWLGTNNWSNNVFPGNNVPWIDGATAFFSATPGTATLNGAVTANGLTFNVDGYVISGASTLTLSGATPAINVSNAGQTAAISAPIGGSAGFTKIGAGTLTLSGFAANSYTGLATVTDGTLNLSKGGADALTGNLTIGDGSGAAASASVVQTTNTQIPDTATVRIEQDGFWNLASGNRSETVGALVMGESSVATGAGTLTLNGNVSTFFPGFDNNYPTATISGLVDLGGATRTFTMNTNADLIVSAAISNGGLTKSGPNTLELSGTVANSYSGATTVTAGRLVLNKTAGVNAIPGDLIIGIGAFINAEVRQGADNQIADTATVTIKAGAGWNLGIGNHSETVAALVMTAGNIFTGSGTLTVNGSVTTNASTEGASIAGQFNLGGATRTFDIADGPAEFDLTIFSVIHGGGLTKTGPGTLLLQAPPPSPSPFSGPVAINGGVVSVSDVADSGASSDLGAGSSVSFDGGALVFTGATDSTNRAVTLNAGGGTVNVTNAAETVTITGAFAGAGGLTKTGPGTLTLGGALANGHAGTTTAADGTLNLNKPASVNAIGGNLAVGDGSGAAASAIVTQGADEQIPDTATVAVVTDGFWNLASGNRSETIAALTMTAARIATGSGTLTVNGNVTTNASATGTSISGQLNLGGATRTFDIAEGAAAIDLDISAAISNGVGGLTKTGGGMLRLGGGSAFGGPVTINAGTLIIDGNGTIGSLAGGGSVVLGTASTLNVGGGSSTTFSGSISGTGGFTKSGAGMLTLSGAPTYTGNTLVSAGTLALNSGIASAAGSLTVNAPGTLQARTTVNRAIAGDGTITATGSLTIGDPSSTAGFAFDGTLAVGSNVVTLADADAAQLGSATTLGASGRLDALNGAILASGRSITAATSASAGISGNLTNNGTVNGPTISGQSLALLGDVNGVGNYTGNVRFSGQLSPGLSAAAVSLENFQLDPTTTLSIELGGVNAGAEFDQLNFTGTGLLDGTLSVSLINGFNPQPGNAFTFIQGGALSGAFDAMNLPPLDPGFSWSYSQTANAAMLAVVPEPALTSLLAAGALAMALLRRPRSFLVR